MSETTEYRGWDIEDNYQQHFLDDPLVDLTEDFSEGNAGAFVGFIVVLAVLIVGMFSRQQWLKTPILVFPTPAAPNVVPYPELFSAQWKVSCIYVNNGAHVIRPNYANDFCTAEAAKKRGEF